jgi:hypothetical protein
MNNAHDPLEDKLRAARPPAQPAPPTFKATLRARLTSQPAGRRNYWESALALGGVLTLVLLVAFFFTPTSQPAASAQNVLQVANDNLAAKGAGDFIHDTLYIELNTALVQTRGMAELWQSADGQQNRFEFYDESSTLLYFRQTDGSTLWLSEHIGPMGIEPVERIYKIGVPMVSSYAAPMETLFSGREMALGWAALDRVIGENQEACSDLFCLLGVDGEGWFCEGETCTFTVNGETSVSLIFMGERTLETGRNIFTFRMTWDELDDWYREIYIDSDYNVFEISDYDRGQLVTRLQLRNRETVPAERISKDFFSQIPAGTELVIFGPESIPEPNKLEIVSVSPPTSTSINKPVTLQVEIEYTLNNRPEALVTGLFFPAEPSGDVGVIERSEPMPIAAGSGNLTLEIPLEPASLASVEWHVVVQLGYFEGATQFITLNETSIGNWCIGCN